MGETCTGVRFSQTITTPTVVYQGIITPGTVVISILPHSRGIPLLDSHSTQSQPVDPTAGTKLHLRMNGTVSAHESSDSEGTNMMAVSNLSYGRQKRRQRSSLSDTLSRSTDIINFFPEGLYFDDKSKWEAFFKKFKQCSVALK